MKKTFLKSIATGIVGLTLIGGCSMFNKEAAHSCKSNSCKAKKETPAVKKETSSCSAKKATAHKCSAQKVDAKKTTTTK